MKYIIIQSLFIFMIQTVSAQDWLDLPDDARFESIVAANDNYWDISDSVSIDQDVSKHHPLIALNQVNAQQLRKALPFLHDKQLESFIQYRKLAGSLLNTYELQAIPNWDLETIKKCIPLVVIKKNFYESYKERSRAPSIQKLSWGSYRNYVQTSNTDGIKYLGSPYNLSLRYSCKKSNFLQWGFQANKDAGEQFFQGTQKYGFDFYSAHCVFKNLGLFKAIAVGDFTVNIGQGLMQWQSFAYGNMADMSAIKRQGPVIKPYTSFAEQHFERGIACTVLKNNKEFSFFVSKKPIDANLIYDTLDGVAFSKATSIINSGLHRTIAEISKKDNMYAESFGSVLSIHTLNGKIGINYLHEKFSIPIQKNNNPFNYFAFSGKRHDLIGTDYFFSFHNFHFFGEAVLSDGQAFAAMSGFLKSVSKKLSIHGYYRNISPSYFSLESNPNIQNNQTANEHGFYMGIQWVLNRTLIWSACTDHFSYPYLKYNINSLTGGSYSAVEFDYSADKKNELLLKFTERRFCENNSNDPYNIQPISEVLVKNVKLEWKNIINSCIKTNTRVQWVKNKCQNQESNTGFLFLTRIQYKHVKIPFTFTGQYVMYETDGYATRLFCTEHEMNGSAFRVLFNKGCVVSSNLMIAVSKKLTLFWKVAFQWRRIDSNQMNELEKSNSVLLKKELNFQFNYIF